jgi:Flp pilus assembly protein TadG
MMMRRTACRLEPETRNGPLGSRRRRGTAAVEFAVVAPLLFTLAFGMIEFGRAMMVTELLNNAARNGARAACLNGNSNANVTSAVTSTLSSLNLNGVTTSVLVNDVTADCNGAIAGDAVKVRVTVPYRNVTWLPFTMFLGDTTIGTTAVMRREG